MPQPIRELVPGVVHWTAPHPRIGIDVSGYLLTGPKVLLDPVMPAEGLEWFEENDLRPEAVLLTNRHHLRAAPAFAERFGCTVHASRPGMHEFEGGPVAVEPFDFGDTLPGGAIAHEVDAICPDETAIELPGVKALAVADGVVNYEVLAFVPDNLMDEPPHTKRGLYDAYERLTDHVDFEHLLLAHALQQRRDLAPQPAVDEHAVQQDDRRLPRAEVAVPDAALRQLDLVQRVPVAALEHLRAPGAARTRAARPGR
jgi:hypothetical protein